MWGVFCKIVWYFLTIEFIRIIFRPFVQQLLLKFVQHSAASEHVFPMLKAVIVQCTARVVTAGLLEASLMLEFITY